MYICPDNRIPYSTKSPSGAGSHAVTVPSKGNDILSKPCLSAPVFHYMREASTWCSTFLSHRTTWQGRTLFLWQELAPKRSQGSSGHPFHPGTPPSGRHCDSLPQTPLFEEADGLQGGPVLCTPHRSSVNALVFLSRRGQLPWLAAQWLTGKLDQCVVHQGTLTLYPRSGFWASGMSSKAMCFYLFFNWLWMILRYQVHEKGECTELGSTNHQSVWWTIHSGGTFWKMFL